MGEVAYGNLIAEIRIVVEALPSLPREHWSDYICRIEAAFAARRSTGRIPEALRRPLNASALSASRNGRGLSIVLAEARWKPPATPVVKKQRPRNDGPAPLKKVEVKPVKKAWQT